MSGSEGSRSAGGGEGWVTGRAITSRVVGAGRGEGRGGGRVDAEASLGGSVMQRGGHGVGIGASPYKGHMFLLVAALWDTSS